MEKILLRSPRLYEFIRVKKSVFLTLYFLKTLIITAAPVSVEEAKDFATRFLHEKLASSQGRIAHHELKLVFTGKEAGFSQPGVNEQALYYIFNQDEEAFVIVSGDDSAYPILAYSLESGFRAEQLPPAFEKWMDYYEGQLKTLIRNPAPASARIKKTWELTEITGTKAVDALVKSKWNQSPFYNDLCPMDQESGKKTVTGCVATAMAQIMKFHQHPKQGTGFHSYQHQKYGNLAANFGLTTYHWDQMPENIQSTNNAVAELNYHVGVSVEMNYGVHGSSAAGTFIVKPALEKFFGYQAKTAERKFYNSDTWIALLQAEIDAGRPVYYQGYGSEGGHAFVCDGYQDDKYFHFNWGWGGMMDGYYFIDDLAPYDVGIGGGNGTYNLDQSIVYGIQPTENPAGSVTSYNLQLYSNIQVTPNPVALNSPFQVNLAIANYGPDEFSGQIAVAISNLDNIYLLLDSISIEHFTKQTYYSLAFHTAGLKTGAPGDYVVGVLYKPDGGDWKLLEGGYQNLVTVEVIGAVNNLVLSEPISLPDNTIVQEIPFTFDFNVTNQGSKNYSSMLYATIFDLSGNALVQLDSFDIQGLPPSYTYNQNLVFRSKGTSIEPGTYLLGLTSEYNNKQTLVSSGIYQNPVTIIIQSPPLLADAYEVNDDIQQASPVKLKQFTNDRAVFKTEGANLHNETDQDFFALEFDPGAEYTLNIRVHDSSDADDGHAYTNDVMFSYSLDGLNWSESFDKELASPLILTNESKVLVRVKPYFATQTGSYALEADVTRTVLPVITITKPVNNAANQAGAEMQISWITDQEGNFDISLFQVDQLVEVIAENVPNTGIINWIIPENIAPATNYRIVIQSLADHRVKAESPDFSIEMITAIETELASQVQLFPNPTRNFIYLDFQHKRPESISVFNISGERLADLKIIGSRLKLDLSSYQQGLYMIHCNWEAGKSSIHKVSKQ